MDSPLQRIVASVAFWVSATFSDLKRLQKSDLKKKICLPFKKIIRKKSKMFSNIFIR
jgi:hypothetical protein